MATTCRTADGDMLDSLCYHVYGHLLGCVEATLDANPGLADEQQPFRAGLLISFPDMPVVNVEQVRLWIDRPLTRNPALAGFFFSGETRCNRVSVSLPTAPTSPSG